MFETDWLVEFIGQALEKEHYAKRRTKEVERRVIEEMLEQERRVDG